MTDTRLGRLLTAVGALDAASGQEARDRHTQLTKPVGALGYLEDLASQLAGIQRRCPPAAMTRPVVAVFAGDHGVHAQGVSPWPQEVTVAMVANIRSGGAAVSVLARQAGADVYVVDMGVAAAPEPGPDLLTHRIGPGTSDLSQGPAMSHDQAVRGILAGAAVADHLVDAGYDCLLTGDMGIANTTPSAALVAAFTGAAPERATGRGTGVDDRTLALKTALVARALRDRPPGADPVRTLASVGGFEHAGLAGFLLGAAARRVPVVLDGLIAGSAALVAAALAPAVVDHCIAGHRGAEPGHALALGQLGLRPVLDLDLRLGEGTGAVLAFPVLESAGAVLREMATFDAAGVTRKEQRR